MQDLQVAQHRAQQGREPSVLRQLQLVRIPTNGHGHQDWFLGPDRQEKEDEGLDGFAYQGEGRIQNKRANHTVNGRGWLAVLSPGFLFFSSYPTYSAYWSGWARRTWCHEDGCTYCRLPSSTVFYLLLVKVGSLRCDMKRHLGWDWLGSNGHSRDGR